MPLYEYKCEGCGDVFEVIQKFADQPLTVHEKCGGAVHRLISRSALQFKGSGWYVNDYAKGSSGQAAGEPAKKNDSGGTTAPATSSSDSNSSSSSSTPASTSTPASDTK